MTYWVWGWDTVEPIAYLLALSVEAVGLWYFIRRGRGLSMKEMFTNKYNSKKLEILKNKKSTNTEA